MPGTRDEILAPRVAAPTLVLLIHAHRCRLSTSTNGAAFNNEWSDVICKDGYHVGDTDENQDVEEDFQAFFRSVNGSKMMIVKITGVGRRGGKG